MCTATAVLVTARFTASCRSLEKRKVRVENIVTDHSQSVEVDIIGSGPCGVAVCEELRMHGVKMHNQVTDALRPTDAGAPYRKMEEYRRLIEHYLVEDEEYWAYEYNNENYD